MVSFSGIKFLILSRQVFIFFPVVLKKIPYSKHIYMYLKIELNNTIFQKLTTLTVKQLASKGQFDVNL